VTAAVLGSAIDVLTGPVLSGVVALLGRAADRSSATPASDSADAMALYLPHHPLT
jgi:hypothetical protein